MITLNIYTFNNIHFYGFHLTLPRLCMCMCVCVCVCIYIYMLYVTVNVF